MCHVNAKRGCETTSRQPVNLSILQQQKIYNKCQIVIKYTAAYNRYLLLAI